MRIDKINQIRKDTKIKTKTILAAALVCTLCACLAGCTGTRTESTATTHGGTTRSKSGESHSY